MVIHTIELFAGVGMLGEGLRSGFDHLGIQTRPVCYVEREAYPSSVLVSRMQEGSLDEAPIWSDVTTFNGKQFAGAVDCVVAGFPCQDLSIAGRRAGLDGKRSGLFFEVVRIARDCGARYLFLENVSGIASATATVVDDEEGELDERAASRVLGELADNGWNAEWITLSASDVGASHKRARWFCWAWRDDVDNTGCVQRGAGHEQNRPSSTKEGQNKAHNWPADRSDALADTECVQPEQHAGEPARPCKAESCRPSGEPAGRSGLLGHTSFAPGPSDPAWAGIIQHSPHLAPALEPSFHRVVDGLEHRMDDCRPQRLKCCGNGVVAAQAAAALVILVQRMMQ